MAPETKRELITKQTYKRVRKFRNKLRPQKDLLTIQSCDCYHLEKERVERIRQLIPNINARLWSRLDVGSTRRYMLKENDETKNILRDIQEELRSFTDTIRFEHKRHRHMHIGVIASEAHANCQKWHYDFDIALVKDLKRRIKPFSIVIALDKCFGFDVKINGCKRHADINPGFFVKFNSDMKHRGGYNTTNKKIYRLHIYFACEEEQIPGNAVYFNCNSNNNNNNNNEN